MRRADGRSSTHGRDRCSGCNDGSASPLHSAHRSGAGQFDNAVEARSNKTWLTCIPCPFCRDAGFEDEAHRVMHDGTAPPPHDRLWGVRCPQHRRLHLIDPTLYEWAEANASVEMDQAAMLREW